MLAVLKKRWKPKRASGGLPQGSNLNNNNNNNINGGGRRVGGVGGGGGVKVAHIIAPTNPPHPDNIAPNITTTPPTIDPNSEKIRVATSHRQVHPVGDKMAVSPAPNICVQAGRIEFIKPQAERIDPVKEKLEARIAELEAQLEEEKKSTLKERRNTARFQTLVEDRESLQRDVEYERGARLEMETRLQEASKHADSTKARLHSLQANVNRLEESLRSMSQYKHKYAQLKLENASLNNALETRMQHFQSALNKLTRENESLKAQLQTLESAGSSEEKLAERLHVVEEENQRLIREREQCENCLDQVAHQVVKALLAQKGLREEVCTLRERVKELETQNRALSTLLLQQFPKQQKLEPNNTSLEVCVRPVSCDDTKLRWADSLLWVPVHRPRSLNLDTQNPVSPKAGECHKDEGYSTMSSEAQGESGNSTGTCGPLERLQEESTALFLDTTHHSRVVDDDVILSMTVLNGRQSFPPWRLSTRAMLRSASDSQLVPYGGGGGSNSQWCQHNGHEETTSIGGGGSAEWWDSDCVQHWLRLEETRTAIQQQIEYDTVAAFELEEWTMDDITPGLSSITESGPELEDLWCPVMDSHTYSLISPGGDSWSSRATSEDHNCDSKRSSATMSDHSDSPPATSSAVGTHFTRDFYRLVKFESTKSLASTSSRSQKGGGGTGVTEPQPATALVGGGAVVDREQALQSVLHFIVEQQQYCRNRQASDTVTKQPTEVPETEEVETGGSSDSLQNTDSGVVSKSSDMSSSEETCGTVAPVGGQLEVAIKGVLPTSLVASRGLLTVPEEDEEHSVASGGATALSISEAPVAPEALRILHFDETATSRQVIEELNKMTRDDDSEASPHCENVNDEACCPTGWVHVEKDIDFNDPKARANLLDVMMSSRSSSSCSGSSESSEDHGDYQHLHRIHRSRRHKKASASREGAGALRRHGIQRVSIVGREDLFLRYGAKEKEAIASFDFLDELTSASSRESTTHRPRETLQ